MKELSSFFVDSFWVASTTFGDVPLSSSERSSLAKEMAKDFTQRYGNSWEAPGRTVGAGGRLFKSRLLLARGPDAAIIGCVGVEAALVDPLSKTVVTAAQAEALVCVELANMDDAEGLSCREVYDTGGIAALASTLFPEYQPLGMLTNLAIAPSQRRSGIGRELCECCEQGAAQWKLPGMLLQVEEANVGALGLYTQMGYEEIYRSSESLALRLRPGASTLASKLLIVESEALLEEVPSTVLTLAKQIQMSCVEPH